MYVGIFSTDYVEKVYRWKTWIKGLFGTFRENHRFLVTGSARLDIYRGCGDSLCVINEIEEPCSPDRSGFPLRSDKQGGMRSLSIFKPKPMQTVKPAPLPLLGAHFSIAGGLDRALYTARDYGCTALQMFTKNASTWKERVLTRQDIEDFDRVRQETGIAAIASHTAYLINLGSPEKTKFEQSCTALKHELTRALQLGIPMVVHHPGAHMGAGESLGMDRIAQGINRVLDESPEFGPLLLLETCAGQGTTLGHSFEQLAEIAEKIEQSERIGFCLDTCHIFAAGYDIRTQTTYHETMTGFDAMLGLDRLHLIHVNDALKDLDSRVDRHTHIGKGKIGINAFAWIMKDERLAHIPKILETPKKEAGMDWDRKNLDCLLDLIISAGPVSWP